MAKQAKGGNVVPANSAARVDITKKCALVAVETPNAPSKTQAIKAPNIDEALKNLSVSYKVQLRRLDGTISKEKINIRSLADFEEATIADNSDVLREQKKRMEFMHEFQNELLHNPVFREELKEFLQSEKKEQFLQFLKGWIAQAKNPDSEFLMMLRS